MRELVCSESPRTAEWGWPESPELREPKPPIYQYHHYQDEHPTCSRHLLRLAPRTGGRNRKLKKAITGGTAS